jgi:hypothetical protein
MDKSLISAKKKVEGTASYIPPAVTPESAFPSTY